MPDNCEFQRRTCLQVLDCWLDIKSYLNMGKYNEHVSLLRKESED